jgi:hypothetical protein
MLNRKVIVFIMVGIFTCVSVFGQDVAKVKEFERARKTIPVAISLNIFGFGIGSFLQGDTKAALIQLGISAVGYAFFLPGILVPVGHGKDAFNEASTKNALIGIGGTIMAANALIGAIRPTLYQFDARFDAFYDINNEARWPGGGD